MSQNSLTIAELDDRIAALRNDIRELVEAAAAQSGAADEELTSRRIAEHEQRLKAMLEQRDALSRSK